MTNEEITEIDVIILSYAYTDELQQMTADCIQSLLASEDSSRIRFKVLVLESHKAMNGYIYAGTETIYPEQPFGYHRYMNIGINLTSSPFLCLCNNDLKFHQGWASEILKYMRQFPLLVSASPICSIIQPYMGVPLNSGPRVGYRVGNEIAGWCLLMRREIFKVIGQLDENYVFGGADFDYATTLAVMNLKHALITTAVVDHLNSKTLVTHNAEKQKELLSNMDYYSKKWGHRILPKVP